MFARLTDPCLCANGLPCIHDEKLLHDCSNMFAGFSKRKTTNIVKITCLNSGEQLSLRGPEQKL